MLRERYFKKYTLVSVLFVSLFALSFAPTVGAYGGASQRVVSGGPATLIGTCPTQGWLTPTGFVPSHSVQILNIHWVVKNDEDSGVDGYWGMDHYTTSLTVWYNGATGDYYAIQKFSGIFVTFTGAVSPGSTAASPNGNVQSESAYGTLVGGILFGPFTGAFLGGPSGNLGTKQYGGSISDILKGYYSAGQTGDSAPYDPFAHYFSGSTALSNEPNWGFAYQLNGFFHESNSINQWCNYASGTTGDIYVP